MDSGRHGTWGGAGDRGKNFSLNPANKESGQRQAKGLGEGLGTEGRILSNPVQQRKWTEAGMGTWGGAGGQREEFISKSSQQRKVDRGRHGDLLRGWGWREELSNSIQQRKWKVERGRHGEDLGRG